MKVAILSDVHGFSLALERVLDDIAAEPGVDQIVVAGDLVESGPDPAGALAILRESGATIIQGNTDRDLAAGDRGSRPARFTEEQLGDDNLRFLANLPFSHRIAPPGGNAPDEDLLVVHANPFDLDRPIHPEASEEELEDLIGDTRAAVIAFGHIHIAYIRRLPRLTLLDVSAVGNPKDGDLRSKWGLATWDGQTGTWSVELRYVEYPLEETIAQFESSGHPKSASAIRKLVRASYDD
jgi:predicted phosphodiesterase